MYLKQEIQDGKLCKDKWIQLRVCDTLYASPVRPEPICQPTLSLEGVGGHIGLGLIVHS